jgi:opacity protein-like surface antigen
MLEEGNGSEGYESRLEILPLLKAGVGLEWKATDNVLFHLQYDYTRRPLESTLTPGSIPEHEHAVKIGVELRF